MRSGESKELSSCAAGKGTQALLQEKNEILSEEREEISGERGERGARQMKASGTG